MSATIEKSILWKLADDWEAIIRDKRATGFIERWVLKKAREELVALLGERELPVWKQKYVD